MMKSRFFCLLIVAALFTITASAQMEYHEAPMLDEMVAAGELPPVADRLPVNPMVVEPLDSIGQYGGTWYGGTAERNPNFYIRNGAYQQLTRWTPEWDGVIPNAAESFEANDEATEFTFKLREGMKWSDGVPLTTADIQFYVEDVILNEEFTPAVPSYLQAGGEPLSLEVVDDYTFIIKFVEPHGLFIPLITGTYADHFLTYPRHYLEQFHPAYNENAAAQAEAEGYTTWMDRFETLTQPHLNAEIPTIRPWNFETSLGNAANNQVVLVRNPYFWKVDPEGNQLPYIDRYVVTLANDTETLVLQALNGELDYQERFISDPINKAVLFDNQEQGNYHFYELTPATVNEMNICLNLNTTDEVMNPVFNQKDFRVALSYAIDRQLIIDLVHVGQGIPHQAAPRPDSDLYNERLATQYTEYDPDQANALLDGLGYTERDGEGFRLMPNGNRLSFVLEIDQARTTYIDALELIKPMWEDVGVEVLIRTMERSLWEERVRSESLEFHGSAHRFGGGTGQAVILDPRYYLPIGDGNSFYAKGWSAWYNNPSSDIAIEPPEQVREAMALYDQIKVESSEERRNELMAQILDIAADQFYCIGTVLEPNAFGVVTNRMRNVPSILPNTYLYPTPGPYNPEQFWIEESS